MCMSLIFLKAAVWKAATLSKKRLQQLFFCEFCESSQNTFKEYGSLPGDCCYLYHLKHQLLSFSFFRLTFQCLFVDLLVHLAYVFVLLVERWRSCKYILTGICFPAPDPQSVFTGPGPQLVFFSPGPQFVFTSPATQLMFACSSFYS